jgi:hypothetical protein
MPFLIAGLAVVGAVCLLDLLLTFGVIRRLREHTELLAGTAVPDVPVIGLTPRQVPAAFETTTTGGVPVHGPAGYQVVSFFSSSCSICPERVAPFLRYLADHHVPAASVLAVVVGPRDEPPPYLERLAGVAQVCTEEHNGVVGKAFKIVGYPAFCVLGPDGAVLAAGYDPAELPEPVAVS